MQKFATNLEYEHFILSGYKKNRIQPSSFGGDGRGGGGGSGGGFGVGLPDIIFDGSRAN